MEKIIIARDESLMVTLKEHENSKRHMMEFTQGMMCTMDDLANLTNQNLKQLMAKTSNEDQYELLNDCADAMRRTRYSIRDFQYIHDVADNNF